MTDEERARAIAGFFSMWHRQARVAFVTGGPVVRAESPDELTSAADAWIEQDKS